MNFKQHALEIKRLLEERKEAVRFLISKGIAPSIAEEISREERSREHMKEVISNRLRITGELSFTSPHKLVFVGPTGVGKTTTILKLVDYYLRQNRKIALMSLDEAKKRNLQIWAGKKGIPFLETILPGTADLILVDTEGCNFYQPSRVDALGEKIAEVGSDVEIVLTLSATAKEVDLYGAVHQFSPLCPSSLAFTKLDETLTPGVLVNVCVRTELPIRYTASGFPLPGELQLANPKDISHKVLMDNNAEEFHLLRELTQK